MSPEVFQEFELILSSRSCGDRVLEIGAVPTSDSLLNIRSLASASELIGINLDGGESYTFGEGELRNQFKLIKANANEMTCFNDDRFDTILCNSVLEHDKYFWKTIAEIRRVAKPGGLIVIGSPGYDQLENVVLRGVPEKNRIHWLNHFKKNYPGTPTLHVHNWPGDYYRFSPQSYKDIIFAGMRDVEVYSILVPPRIIGIGYNV